MKLSQEPLGVHQELRTRPSCVNGVSGAIPSKLKLCGLEGRKCASDGPPRPHLTAGFPETHSQQGALGLGSSAFPEQGTAD